MPGAESLPAPAGDWLGPDLEKSVQLLSGEPFTRGNEIRFMVDGPEYFPVRLDLIQNAASTIDLTTFLWCDDDAGLAVARALAEASSVRHVRVRVMVDGLNNKDHDQAYKIMTDAHVHLVKFNPPSWGAQDVLKRAHEKIMVVDGERALVGGANLCDEYMLTTAKRGMWHDQEFLAQGPVVARIQDRLDHTWNWVAHRENEVRLDPNLPYQIPLPIYKEPTPAPRAEVGSARAVFLYQQPLIRPDDEDRSMELYARLFRSAKEHILFYDAYLIPPKVIELALEDRARNHVRVDIVTNSSGSNDMGPIFVQSSVTNYARLMKAGAHIWESRKRTYHNKGFLVDRTMLAVGSHNLTHIKNGESDLLTDDPAAMDRFEKMFADDQEGGDVGIYEVTPKILIDKARTLGDQTYLIVGTWLHGLF
jgi:cardiolipin synthase